MNDEKQILWVGSAYDDLLAFPKDARKEAGFQLGKVQAGFEPTDWKPLDDVGAGTREIRIRDATGIYRVMYVSKFEEAIYVLHCLQKKTQGIREREAGCPTWKPTCPAKLAWRVSLAEEKKWAYNADSGELVGGTSPRHAPTCGAYASTRSVP
jgi:phage-related protein